MKGEEKVWAWRMPSGELYTVVTNHVDGTIKVYDPAGTLVKQDENLSRAALSLIEKNFLENVATEVKGNEAEKETMDEIRLYIR
jgi:hypothetical protein